MRKTYAALAGAMMLLVAAACTDRTAITDVGGRGLTPKGASHTMVTGAGFTTVDQTIDGTGHCRNGNPLVNCNIYDGKQYVWLNGGPSTAYVGDGTYFFAVLAPGGQADPNDGTPKNLSDDFDAYTNRTFSVVGGTVTYSGTHDFDPNKIRLFNYADTPNLGGVYILAICSLGANGTTYPVDPSKCKYDAFKVDLTPPCTQDCGGGPAEDLVVSKDAAGSNDRKYAWGITKDVDKTLVKQIGGTVTFTYTVAVTHDTGTVSNVKVTGTITVTNSNVDPANNNAIVPVNDVTVTDQLSTGTVCSVTGGNDVTVSSFSNTFSYSCDLGSTVPALPIDNTATVAWLVQDLSNGKHLAAGSGDFTFTIHAFSENKIDESITVADPVAGAGNFGTATYTDPSPKTFATYTRIVNVPASGCSSYDNTATFTTNDTQATGSASKTVTVCGPAATGALTMGFWKGPNGAALISNYCLPSSKPSLSTYLAGLGGGSGPFTGATAQTTCAKLNMYINGILAAASATNMNAMLKAQMLATALDVYFTDPSFGWTATPVGSGKTAVKPPQAFLPNTPLGAFVMDLTAVCPMVDNTTAGTATCSGVKPSTNAFASGAAPAASLTVQAILDFAATNPAPFSAGVWYAGDRTKQETLKNIFDQINNQDAFAP